MDFGFDARTLDLRKQLLTFMDERVYPAEAVYTEQVDGAEARGQLWERAPVTADLKAEARSRGLWNLFLTGKAAQAVRKLDPSLLPDPQLTNLQYAPLAEITGPTGLAAGIGSISSSILQSRMSSSAISTFKLSRSGRSTTSR